MAKITIDYDDGSSVKVDATDFVLLYEDKGLFNAYELASLDFLSLAAKWIDKRVDVDLDQLFLFRKKKGGLS